MFKIIYCVICSFIILYAQNNSYHSPENIRLFADYLFCQNDYLRAIEEYKRLENSTASDTLIFKIGYSYLQIKQHNYANKYFDMIERSSSLKSLAVNYNSLNFFLIKDFSSLKNNYRLNSDSDLNDSKKLLLVSSILNENIFPSDEQIFLFDDSDRLFVNDLIIKKKYPDYKSPTVAGILSVIPGAGKVYTKNYTDGLTSFLLTGLFTFLAYDNFRNSHHFRGYIFSFAATGFYLGNIYGSIISAYRYNRNYDEKIITETYDYLKQKNYFIKKVNFCE